MQCERCGVHYAVSSCTDKLKRKSNANLFNVSRGVQYTLCSEQYVACNVMVALKSLKGKVMQTYFMSKKMSARLILYETDTEHNFHQLGPTGPSWS